MKKFLTPKSLAVGVFCVIAVPLAVTVTADACDGDAKEIAPSPAVQNQVSSNEGAGSILKPSPSTQTGTQLSDGTGAVRMTGHLLPRQMNAARHIGRVPTNQKLVLTVPLKLRDSAGLAAFILRVQNPSDPLYGKYLTPSEFAQKFAPSEVDYQNVVSFLKRQGFEIISTSPHRMSVAIQGNVAAVEHAFQIEMHQYQAADGRTVFSPNVDPVAPTAIAGLIHGIVGLNNFTHFHNYVHVAKQPAGAHSDSGAINGLTPASIKKAYSLSNVSLTGAGQTLALVELDGYTPSDISGYATQFGIASPPPLQNILVDGVDGIPSSGANSGAIEVTLDIELMISLAPGATKILIYEGPNTDQGVIDVLTRIATDNLAASISTSWGSAEGDVVSATLNAENSLLMQIAAQGQSFFAAAGDSGAFDNGSTLSVDDPGSQPYMTSVGGTTLTLNSDGSYGKETSWAVQGGSVKEGGGGGISAVWPIPTWQQNLGTAANQGSTTMRMVPDVALDADPNSGYAIFSQGAWQEVGGTSCAAPLWAAFTALVNQQRAINGQGGLGFPNLSLYSDAESSAYTVNFHDIADGSANLHFTAVKGYDLSTGWGTMIGSSLLASLGSTRLTPAVTSKLAEQSKSNR